MRDDLLKIISSSKDVTNAVVLTHNIDFVFLQTVVLKAFRDCGQPTLTVFADAQCAAESYAHQAPVLDGLGFRYRVVPVAMESGFRFHPKAVLLSGPKEATLLVGSGNLTFGGWRENAEVWTRFSTEEDGTARFAAFRNYLEGIIQRISLKESVASEVGEAFDPKTKFWASEGLDDASGLLGRIGSEKPLLEQMMGSVGPIGVEQLVVCCPYFDAEGKALAQIISDASASRNTVLCQPSRSTLTKRGWKTVKKQAELVPIDFQHTPEAEEPRSALIHAKYYAFLSGKDAVVFSGSANCSQAALTIPGRRGNAELLVEQRMTRDEYQQTFEQELITGSGKIDLHDKADEKNTEDDDAGPTLRVLAARYENGRILVGFSPSDAEIEKCEVDGTPVPFVPVDKGILRASCLGEPRSIVLRGVVGGDSLDSAPCWVDHEHRLRSTARGRNVADSIRAHLQPGEWNVGAWTEVMDVFLKDLSYLPSQELFGGSSGRTGDGEDAGAPEFTAEDVFASDYRPSALQKLGIPMSDSAGGRVRSLQQLLLRWFGIAGDEDEGDADTDEHDVDDDDSVDRPERLSQIPPPPTSPEISDRDRRRIQKILPQLQEAMTSTEFLEERRPDSLAADLKVAAVLLRTGLREGWIEQSEFFEVTHAIWTSLFFTSEPDPSTGWLEHRAAQSEDRQGFIDAIRSPDLSAALVGWVIAVPTDDMTAEHARFFLATALSVARLPWIWQGGESMDVARELLTLLNHTAGSNVDRDEQLKLADEAWQMILRRGQALGRLEKAMASHTPVEVRSRITQSQLTCGELLWQGTAGFCVVSQDCERAENVNVPVLRLQGIEEEGQFKAPYTVPLGSLLDESVLPLTDDFGEGPREVLAEMLEQMRGSFVDSAEKS